jgi:cell wall-associated NlpC family hydrolase
VRWLPCAGHDRGPTQRKASVISASARHGTQKQNPAPHPTHRGRIVAAIAVVIGGLVLAGTAAGAATKHHPVKTPKLSWSRTAINHQPVGEVLWSVSGNQATFHGWAADYDAPNRSLRLNYSLNGRLVAKPVSNLNYASVDSTNHISGAHSFRQTWTLKTGVSRICVSAVNIGAGSGKSILGCATIDVAGKGQAILNYADQFVGKVPYVANGASPSGFDCSGLTSYVYEHFGLSLPHSAQGQFNMFRQISQVQAKPGDLIFFHSGGGVYHVGFYAGGDQMVAATTQGEGIRQQTIWSPDITFGTILH